MGTKRLESDGDRPPEAEISVPTPIGNEGRDNKGRFAKGNKGGPGHPLSGRVNQLRSMLLEAITEDDLNAIVKQLVTKARGGELTAITEILNRLLGKPAVEISMDVNATSVNLLAVYEEVVHADD